MVPPESRMSVHSEEQFPLHTLGQFRPTRVCRQVPVPVSCSSSGSGLVFIPFLRKSA